MSTRIDPIRMSATEHLTREYFGDPAVFGMRFPLRKGFHVAAGKLVLAICGADGHVSAAERAACEASAQLWGATPAEAREIASFDVRSAKLGSLLTDELRDLAPMLVLDAVRIARVDGFHEKERETTMQAARALGLAPSVVPAIEGILGLDHVMREARARLLEVPYEHAGAGPMVPPSPARGMEYGSPAAAPVEIMRRIPEAIKIVAASDGELSDAEQAWLVGQGRLVGMPEEAIEANLKFDPVGKRIEDHVDESMRPYAKLILFDAIRCARVDGFHAREREMAQRAGEKLGLDATFVTALENQIRTEDGVRDLRFRILTGARVR